MSKDRLYARIREDDVIIREHFDTIKSSDYSYELRRLLEKAIVIERKEKEILDGMNIYNGQDS